MTELAALNVSIKGDATNLSAAIRTANDQLTSFGRVTSAAEAKARGFDGALSKTAKSLTDAQKSANSFAGVLDDVNTSAAASAAAFMQFEKSAAAVDQLRASIDPIFAASKRYEAAIEQLNIALQQGVISQRQYEAMTERVGNAFLGAGHAAAPMSGAMGRVGQAMNGARGQIQNVAFQLQDMAVQLQGGTAASIVFAQQGSQIASAFGPVGAVIGALAAVGIPALAFAFGSASNGAQQFQDALSALDDQVSELNELLGSVTVENYDEMIERYGVLNQAVYENIAAMTALNAQLISMASVDLGGLFSEAFGGMLTSRVDEMRIAFETTNDQARQLLLLMDNVGAARGPDELIAAMTTLRDQLISTAGGINNLTVEQAQFVLEITRAIDQANMAKGALEQLVPPTEQTATEADRIAQNMAAAYQQYAMSRNMAIELANETANAAEQARLLAEARLAGMAIENSPAGQAMEKYGGRGATSNRPVTLGDGTELTPDATGAAMGGGVRRQGGGGGRVAAQNPIVAELEALQESLMTQEQLQAESFARQKEVLDQALQDRLVTQEQYAALMEGVEASHAAKMQKSTMGMVSSVLGSMSQLFQGSKPLAIATALVNTWQGVTEALKLPFPKNIAAAATTLATGMNAVRNIRSTNQSGGGAASSAISARSAGASAAASAGASPAQTPTTTFQFTLTNDPFGFGENFARQFIDQLNATQRNGGQIRGVIA